MSSVNKVILIGNAGQEPVINQTVEGKSIINFTLATSEYWKDKNSGERKEKIEWHRIVVFNENLVKLVQSYVHKGSKLYIEGALQTRKWVDKDGAEKYTTEVVLQNFNGVITLLDKRDDASEPVNKYIPTQAEFDANKNAPAVPITGWALEGGVKF